MSTALTLVLVLALAVAAIHLALDRGRPHPGEFDDIAELDRHTRARAALARATRTENP